jgi:hypothetical protein
MQAAILKLTRTKVLPLVVVLGLATVVRAQTANGLDAKGVAGRSHPAQPEKRPAIAFDQIDRVFLHGASPAPIDSFAADAEVIAALKPLKANAKSKVKAVAKTAASMLIATAVNSIPFAGPMVGTATSRATNTLEQAAERRENERHQAEVAHFISAGTLSRFAFYQEWLRSEHRGEITIVKPDESLTAVLDVANKTAQLIDMRTAPETIEIDTQDAPPTALVGEPLIERLPDATLGGLPARGYRITATIELKQAMLWCGPGRHTVTQVEYVTDLPDPQRIENVPAARTLADGCQPASTESYREPGRLVLYRATSIDADTPKGVALMFERGNVHPLSQRDLSLFSVPADFTKE